jgi:hypothetical protein
MKLCTGILLLVSCSTSAIAANQCISSLPSHRQGHWHYRYVDGEKCWYGPGAESVRVESSRTESVRLSRRHQDRDLGPRRRDPGQMAPPTPIVSLAANIEEERDEPLEPSVKRVRVVPFTVPLSPNRRLQRTFEELVDACQMSIDACEAFTHR